MRRIVMGSLGLVLAFASLAAAQQVTTERPAPGTTENHRVSQILGSTVNLHDGSGYGKVEDIVIGPDNRIDYLIVSHDGQFVSLPWEVGRYEPTRRIVSYDVAPQAIQPLGFAPNAWPNFGDPVYVKRVRTVFPRWTPRGVRIGGAIVAPVP